MRTVNIVNEFGGGIYSKTDNTIVIAPSVGSVIDYENYTRKVIGLPVRPYDLNHSKTIKTNYR